MQHNVDYVALKKAAERTFNDKKNGESQNMESEKTVSNEINLSGGQQNRIARHKSKLSVANIIGIVLCVLLFPGFLINVILLISSLIKPDVPPSCFGITPLIVESGSMSPSFEKNDLILIRNTSENDKYEKGTVVCYRSGDVYVTHRIVKVSEENGKTVYTTQGDANNTPDRDTVGAEQILGVYSTHFAGMGNMLLFIQTPIGMILCVILPIFVIFLIFTVPSRISQRKKRYKYLTAKETKKDTEDKI